MMGKTIIEALHDLDKLELTKDKIDGRLLTFIGTYIFDNDSYKIDQKVEDVIGFPALGVTCRRGLEDCRTVVTVIHLKNDGDGLSEKHFNKVKQRTIELAESELSAGAILTIWEKIDREMLSPEKKVDALVNEYTTYEYVLSFV